MSYPKPDHALFVEGPHVYFMINGKKTHSRDVLSMPRAKVNALCQAARLAYGQPVSMPGFTETIEPSLTRSRRAMGDTPRSKPAVARKKSP